MREPLRIEVDHAQDRAWPDALRVLAQGSYKGQNGQPVPGWDPFLSSSGSYVDPVTSTGFCQPAPLSTDWTTTTSGIYARYQLSDFDLASPGFWQQTAQTVAGDHWLEAKGVNITTAAVTKVACPANTGYYVEYFDFNPSGGDYEVLRLGWGPTADYLGDGPALRVFSGGRIVLYKGGKTLGVFSLGAGQVPSGSAQQYVGLVLMPTRRTELLVVSKAGGGFSHAFEDIDDDGGATLPDVTPAGKFWLQVPYQGQTRAAKVQVAKLQFSATARLVSKILTFADAPQPSQVGPGTVVYADTYGGTATGSVVETDGTTPFVADGTKKDCRVAVDLAVSGAASPALYGCTGYFDGVLRQTGTPSFPLADYAVRASWSVGERGDSVKASVAVMRHAEAVAAGLAPLHGPSNRPFRMFFQADGGSEVPLFEGVTDPADFDLANDPDTDVYSVSARDLFGMMADYRFRDTVPLDGVLLEDALSFLVDCAVSPSCPRDIYPSGFPIPRRATAARGDFTALIKVDDTAGEWWHRLIENYAPDWFEGFVPRAGGTTAVACPLSHLGDEPCLTVYGTFDEAMAALVAEGMDERTARKNAKERVYHSFRCHSLPPEANIAYITGWDARRDVPVQVYRADYDSQDPTWAPGDRPDNWVGRPRAYGWIDTAITDFSTASRCLDLLWPRLSVRRRMAEIVGGCYRKADGSVVWKGDVLRLGADGDKYRVTALEGESFGLEADEPEGLGSWHTREVRYCLERIERPAAEDAWRGKARGSNLGAVVAEWFMPEARVTRIAKGSEFLAGRSPYSRSEG